MGWTNTNRCRCKTLGRCPRPGDRSGKRELPERRRSRRPKDLIPIPAVSSGPRVPGPRRSRRPRSVIRRPPRRRPRVIPLRRRRSRVVRFPDSRPRAAPSARSPGAAAFRIAWEDDPDHGAPARPRFGRDESVNRRCRSEPPAAKAPTVPRRDAPTECARVASTDGSRGSDRTEHPAGGRRLRASRGPYTKLAAPTARRRPTCTAGAICCLGCRCKRRCDHRARCRRRRRSSRRDSGLPCKDPGSST